MKFLIYRTSQGASSKEPPWKGAVRGPEAKGWPGEYQWLVKLDSLEDLIGLLEQSGGALGLFTPEEGEEHPAIEIFDEEEEEG